MDNDNTVLNTETQVVEGQENNTPKTYTEQEVQEMLQRESDRRVTEALKKQEKKNAEKLREAERLAQMNESEKFQYQLEQREKAVAEKERELALAENKVEAGKILSEKGLSLSLVDFVVAEDADTMAANIKLLENAFNNSVKAEVEKRLASKAPRQNLPLDKPITQTDFAKMSYTEMLALKQQNPDLYRQLAQ